MIHFIILAHRPEAPGEKLSARHPPPAIFQKNVGLFYFVRNISVPAPVPIKYYSKSKLKSSCSNMSPPA